MSFFEDVLDRLFPKKGGSNEVVHETLVRSEKEFEAYKAWMNSEASRDLLREVENAYFLKKKDILSEPDVHLLTTQYANGFAISYWEGVGPEVFKFLFDLLKDKTLTLHYRLAQKDRRILDKNGTEETIEKWYLKPVRGEKDADGLVNQRYGNVLIEHVEVNRKPSYIKLMVNIYQDRLYTKALSFDDYIDELFKD